MGFLRWLNGPDLYDSWFLGDFPAPDVIVNGRDIKKESRNINFKALERALRADESRAKAARAKLRGQFRGR